MKRNTHNPSISLFLDALATRGDIPHSTKRVDRISCSGDASGSPFYHWRWKYEVLPDVVIWPRNADDIVRVMNLASEHSVPVTPRGGGTCYSGSSVPTLGGILLDMKRMGGMTLLADGQRVVVQAGATFAKVNTHLHEHGLSLPTWPTSAMGATIGGWISTGGHVGFGTARYGGFREHVVELDVVHPSGATEHVIEPAGIERYFGTCGTLGIIVSATIKVIPEAKVSPSCFFFLSKDGLFATISDFLSADKKPTFIRFSDRSSVQLPDGDPGASWMLLVMHDGDLQPMIGIVEKHGGKYLGAEASRLCGQDTLAYETLPKDRSPVLMLQQFLLSLHDCFTLIDASHNVATSLDLPLATTGIVTSADRVRLVIEAPADNDQWTQFMAKKAMLHEIVKKAYKLGLGHVYTSGMLNAMYMARFERVSIARWLLEKKRIDPAGILNPFKHGESKISFLRIDVLFSINVAWRRLAVLTKRNGLVKDSGGLNETALESPLKRCAHCEACRDACPVYSVLENEAVHASGRHRVISAYERNAFAPDVELSSELAACTTCGACKVSCPLKIDHAAFTIDRRSRVNCVDGIANEKHEAIRESYMEEGNVYGEPHDRRSDWMQGVHEGQFHIVDHGDVAYFTGCTATFRSRETAISTLTLLSRIVPEGVVVLGNEEECCGGPLVRVGQDRRAVVSARVREMVLKLVRRGVKRVVFSCPGCYSAAVEYWPRFLDSKLPFEVMHVVEFVASAVRRDTVRFNEVAINATYHDPCHLGRQLGVFDAPREILAVIPGLRLVEMEHNRERAACCGAGGGVRSALPEVASLIAARRVEEARRTGASTVVTSCVFCVQAIRKAIEVSHTQMNCVDIVELLSTSIIAGDERKKAGEPA